MVTKYQNNAMGYFLARSTFLGIGFSLILGLTKQDSIISFIAGTLIGILMILLINKIQKLKGKQNLTDLLAEMKVYGFFLRILLLLMSMFLFVTALIIFQVFASSFFLTKTPLGFILLPIIILILIITNRGIKVLYGVGGFLFPISLFLTVISLIALCGYILPDNIMPLFITNKIPMLKSTLFYASLTTTPYLLSLISTENNNHNIPSYLLAAMTLIFKVVLIIGILGPILSVIYRFPEYLILREIRLMNFIEKIENIVSLSWIFDTFIYLSLTSLFIKELLPKYKNKIIHFILIIILYVVTYKFIGKRYEIELSSYYILPYICLAISLIVIPSLLIYLIHKKNKITNQIEK